MVRFLTASRYGCVAALCAGLHNGIMIGADLASLDYLLSLAASFVVTLLVAYALHCRWTFARRPSLTGFAHYGAAMLVNLPVSAVLLAMLYQGMALPMVIAAPLATLMQFGLNYAITAWSLAPHAHGRARPPA